ncbi:hypothetical protein B0H11DRAFT_1963507 [Mycena galericulata]|nr:hypothetical protein B0H11DRAFT_1963507 [Mycena galericulata]
MPPLATARASNAAWKPAYTPARNLRRRNLRHRAGHREAFARHTNGTAHIILVGRNRAAALAILARLPRPPPISPENSTPPRQLAARFPRVHLLVLSAGGAISLAGLDSHGGRCRQAGWRRCTTEARVDRRAPPFAAVPPKGERGGARAVGGGWHTAGRGGPIDLADLGAQGGDRRRAGKRFALRAPSITFMHTHPGTVDTPLLRASPSAVLRAAHRIRFLLFPTLWWRAKSIEQCGEQQLCGILSAPPGASRIDGEGNDIGLGGGADPGWTEARTALWAHSEGVVGGVGI